MRMKRTKSNSKKWNINEKSVSVHIYRFGVHFDWDLRDLSVHRASFGGCCHLNWNDKKHTEREREQKTTYYLSDCCCCYCPHINIRFRIFEPMLHVRFRWFLSNHSSAFWCKITAIYKCSHHEWLAANSFVLIFCHRLTNFSPVKLYCYHIGHGRFSINGVASRPIAARSCRRISIDFSFNSFPFIMVSSGSEHEHGHA